MKSLRPWIQVGVLIAIAPWSMPRSATSDEPTPVTADGAAAKSAESQPANLRPEPEDSLPAQTPTVTAEKTKNAPKPQTAVDLDSQFESPIEINRRPADTADAKVESLFETPNTAQSPTAKPEPTPQPAELPVPAPVIEQPADPLLQLVNEAIDVSGRRFLTADVHTPWQIIHGLLAYRQDFQLKTKDGRKINALEWASSGVTFQGESLFQKTEFGGRAHPFKTPYWFEGHPTQFMAYLTMSRLPGTQQFKTADGQVITVADIINNAKMDVNREEEMTWTLWALAHYLEPDAMWINKKGEPWSIEELVKLELKSTVYDAPCGGTHGLFALAYARNSHLQSRKPLRGVWLEADQKIQRFIAEGRSLQNGDGSFSIHFFKGAGYSNDFNTRITSSGHMIEWLMVALPQSRLHEEWIQNGVRCLAQDLITNRNQNAECGPLYHAVDGLQIYRERMKLAGRIASKPETATGWKPAPNSATQPTIAKGLILESDVVTTKILPQNSQPQTKSIRIAPGVEIIVPRRNSPNSPFNNRAIQSAEKPGKSSRR